MTRTPGQVPPTGEGSDTLSEGQLLPDHFEQRYRFIVG
jgi:hypothetical protein